ncbi:phage baseplate protein [Dryocola sp. BD586]|jgi:hypothetical protein|uniref:phage baseplate protein n=1 Tax=Dryocola sp. BD586 TaxID=3133271 RepID=UPI003F4FDC47
MDTVSALFQRPTRGFAFLVPEVTISEVHTDSLNIALHPVEIGANISDHAWKMPGELVLKCGFGGGGSLVDSFNTTAFGVGLGLSPAQVYQHILALQGDCEPFDVITGKRTYHNMLLKQLQVTTEKNTENVLVCTLTLIEVLLSATQVLTSADKANMSRGVSTSRVQNGGTKTTTPIGTWSMSNL